SAAPGSERVARPAAAGARGRRAEAAATVDHVPGVVLVRLPRDCARLADAQLAPVTDPGRERLLQSLPLIRAERDRVVVRLPERLELALVAVGGDALTGDRVRRPEPGLSFLQLADLADAGHRDRLNAVDVRAAVVDVARPIAHDLRGQRAGRVVGLHP